MIVPPSIHLDAELQRIAVEVEQVRADGMLPPKQPPVEAAALQP